MSIRAKGKKKIFWCDFRTSDGQRIRRSLHTTDRKEAEELEAKLKAETDPKAQRQPHRGDLTLEEAFKHALRVRDAWRSADSPESIHGIYRSVVKHFGGDRRLGSIDGVTLLDYGDELIKAGLSPSTVSKRQSFIKALFEEARRFGKFEGTIPEVYRPKVRNCRRRIITSEEEDRILSILRSEDTVLASTMADLIVILADTGARLSEALGITPSRVNVEAHTVLLGNIKSGNHRIVPLTERALEILARRNCTPMFAPLTGSSCRQIWRKVRRQMGLAQDKSFVFQAFRCTFASALVNKGFGDEIRLPRLMGHKSILTTQRSVLVSISPNTMREVVQIMEKRNSKVSPQKGKDG